MERCHLKGSYKGKIISLNLIREILSYLIREILQYKINLIREKYIK